MSQDMKVGLTPAPTNLYLSQKTTTWKTVRSMLFLVIVLFFFVQISVITVSGFLDSDLDGDFGPPDPLMVVAGSLCSTPFLLAFFILIKPHLLHIIRAEPNHAGQNAHLITPSTLIQTHTMTTIQHHLVPNTGPLQIPPVKQLWLIFIVGTLISTFAMMPLLIFGFTNLSILMFILVAIPAWLIGFSTPVFAWWSTTNEYFGLKTTRRQGEWMLIAGMLSTFPALMINSIIFPILLSIFGLQFQQPDDLGYGMILFISAPIGEELSKALAVLLLARYIDSPRRGFQIGFSVGLGFALLENMIYISGSILTGEGAAVSFAFTSVLRAISSVPGHATWTAISGYAIGCYILKQSHKISILNDENSKNLNNNWVLFDAKTGQAIGSSSSPINFRPLPRWIASSSGKYLPLTDNPVYALMIAIAGHSAWNGSLWIVGNLFAESSALVLVAANLGLMIALTATLWFVLRRIIPFALSVEADNSNLA